MVNNQSENDKLVRKAERTKWSPAGGASGTMRVPFFKAFGVKLVAASQLNCVTSG